MARHHAQRLAHGLGGAASHGVGRVVGRVVGRGLGAGAVRTLLVVPVFAAAAVSCGADVESDDDYTSANREAFLAACTTSERTIGDGEGDIRLIEDVCECTYDQIEETINFAEFVALEESLRLDTLAPLPPPIAALMADCFLAEAEL